MLFWVPLLAALVGGAFAAAVLRQYSSRRKPYQAVWAAALALFAVAALFETAGIGAGWSSASYKGYYLFGGILNVGWLAVGTVYLLARRRAGDLAAAAMGLISLGALAAVLASSTDAAHLTAAVPGRGAISAPAIYFPPLTNILGSAALVGGAGWSAWTGWRRRAPRSRVIGIALIAAGAFVVAGTHSLAQVRGIYLIQPLGEAIGIAAMFGGYLAVEARVPAPVSRPTTA